MFWRGRRTPRRSETENDDSRTRRRRWYLLAAFALVLVFITSSTHVRLGFQSAAFLNEVFPDAPAYPARWFEPEPERVMVQFPHGDEHHGAFLYQPARPGCYAGLVLYIGLGPEHGDRHLDRIARAFARNGIVVLIPVSEPMIDYRLDPEEHLIAASAFQYLQRYEHVHSDRVGLFGVSVGGSVVVNAAQEPVINRDVAMVHSLGGYFDARTVLGYMAVGAYYVNGEWVDWEPSSATIRATRNTVLPLLPSDDRVALWELFDTETTEIPSELSEEGEALARLLVNRDPEQIDDLLEELPPDVDSYLKSISPAGRVESLFADLLLLHDRYDHVLPYSESVRFAEVAEGRENGETYLTIIEQFHHVRPDEEGDRLSLLGDGAKLYMHIYQMHRSLDDRGWFTSPLGLLPGVTRDSRCQDQDDGTGRVNESGAETSDRTRSTIRTARRYRELVDERTCDRLLVAGIPDQSGYPLSPDQVLTSSRAHG
jgi:hypothetical protein